jgi:hypothetical protein
MPFMPAILRFFRNRFVGQDQRTMEKRALGMKHNPPLMLIDDADRPAKWYFQLKAWLLEGPKNRPGPTLSYRRPHDAPLAVLMKDLWRLRSAELISLHSAS